MIVTFHLKSGKAITITDIKEVEYKFGEYGFMSYQLIPETSKNPQKPKFIINPASIEAITWEEDEDHRTIS